MRAAFREEFTVKVYCGEEERRRVAGVVLCCCVREIRADASDDDCSRVTGARRYGVKMVREDIDETRLPCLRYVALGEMDFGFRQLHHEALYPMGTPDGMTKDRD
jgi:hypothetical protein